MASKTVRAAASATDALKILWEENFFVGWKKVGPIEDVLAKRGNHFTDAELGMALKRAKHLTRKGKRRLYQEGAKRPKMMSIGLHCRIAGKPGRALAVQRFLEYARRHSDVWFARRIDIARWWLEHHPPRAGA